MSEKNIDMYFFQLVATLQMATMQNLGKNSTSESGNVGVNLEQARTTIEMIAILAEKTEGNLTNEEKELIDSVLFELRSEFDDCRKSEDQKKSN